MLNDLLSANWIKSAWGFLISAQQWYLSFFFLQQSHVVCMSWICFRRMNLFIFCQWKPFEHEWERKQWAIMKEKVRFRVCLCGDFFLDGTSKPRQSNKTACSVCIISHTNSLYTHNLSSRTKHNHTNAANHSSIFYARMHKTLASLCKLQLMWEGGKKPREHAENAKVERRSEREQIQTESRKRNKSK